ncbi:MAG: sensor histidine kinase [Rhodospirillales bacterium]|nr:sensor histidine kinase [Rhodospirillales bacterium]
MQITGVALLVLFERNVIRHVHTELDAALAMLATFLQRGDNGEPQVKSELADLRLRQLFPGRYWQISANGKSLARSLSLLDTELEVASLPAPEEGIRRQHLVRPNKQQLYASVRRIVLRPAAAGQQPADYLLVVGMDVNEIRALDALNTRLRRDVFTAFGLLAVLLAAAAWAQVSVGLRPLEVVRTGLEKIRLGKSRRLSDKVPSEVQPLVNETNRMLEAQETAIEVARARAADLAHGLKTPLTALTALAAKLRQQDKAELASELEHYIKGLAMHVERELTRTRIAASATLAQNTPVKSIAARLFRTMEKLPRGDQIDWELNCEPELTAPVEEADFAEILGNLLDNARKWARSEVSLTARSIGKSVELLIEDDGPGVEEVNHARVLRRGMRLDETVPGSGLGLSITKSVVEA